MSDFVGALAKINNLKMEGTNFLEDPNIKDVVLKQQQIDQHCSSALLQLALTDQKHPKFIAEFEKLEGFMDELTSTSQNSTPASRNRK